MKKLFKDLSIRLKIILLITFIGGFTLITATFAFLTIDYRNFIKNQISELSVFAKVFGESNSAVIFFEDIFNAQAYLSSIKNSPVIKNVTIFSINAEYNKFKFFADYAIEENNIKNFDFTVRNIDTSWVDGNTINVFQSIKFRDINHFSEDIIGAIYIQSHLPIKIRLWQYIKIILIVIFSSSLIAFLLTLKLQGFITSPLLNLQTLVSKVKNDNNFKLRALIETNDEVGKLATDVNNLLEHIEIQNNELVSAKEEALELVKIKEQFVANMSHEIRTPMNAILGMTNILMDSNLTVEQLKYLKNIKVSAENLLVIINDILDFSKIQSGNIQIEHIPFQLNKIVKQVFNTLKYSADKKGLKLKYLIHDNVNNHLLGDPIRLNQILLNIIGNGIKFTEKGSVSLDVISSYAETDYTLLQFIISDTGIGIKPEKQQTIFESFQQESTETTRKYGGTGLGLSISKQLVELQKGKIYLKSKVDAGSVFTIELPFELSDEPVIEKNEFILTESLLNQMQQMNILLAEDNKLNQLVAKEILKKYKVKLTVANDGGEAIVASDSLKFNAILLDLHMPVKDGFEVAKHIREYSPENKDTLIIALTAAATKAEIDKSFAVGMNKFVSKPFSEEELISAILSNYKSDDNSNMINSTKNQVSITNLSYLQTMSGGNIKIIKEMVILFKEQIPIYIKELETALQNKDYKQLSEIAHKTKSSLTIVGMNEMATEMKTLELKAKESEEPDSYPEYLSNLIAAVNTGIIELENKIELLS
jgi:signal transduction histidine kinase/CheY-like chemotaxis protein